MGRFLVAYLYHLECMNTEKSLEGIFFLQKYSLPFCIAEQGRMGQARTGSQCRPFNSDMMHSL